VQSEWMKIVFEEEPPRHRHRWGPMSRMPLLNRPVQITVRSMQFAARANPLQSQNSARGRAMVATKTLQRSVKKESNGSKRKLIASVEVVPKGGLPPRKGSSVKQGTATKRPLAEFSGSSPTVSIAPSVSSPPFTPRKHHRRNGSASPPPVTPRQILRAKGPGGQSISHDLMEPLPFDIRTLGENRSLPNDWGEEQVAEYRRSTLQWPLNVDPLGRMTVGQLADHIKSVRREGRVENFDHASEILSKLMTHPRNDRGLYNVPVDPVALGLPTYTALVKVRLPALMCQFGGRLTRLSMQHPMDLGTIKSRLVHGEYVEIDAFAADVRLVFENAMLFNDKNHYVHVNAAVLLQLFENAMRGERERQSRRTKPSRHICLVCRGNQCSMCQQHCLSFAPPHLQCSGGCAADFRKGSIYFSTRDGTRVYCQKCKSRMDKESDSAGPHQLSSSQATQSSDGDGGESMQSSQSTAEDPVAPSALIKNKCEVEVEPWVRCTDCNKWLHQVCGLYNPVLGVYAREHKYVCPLCHWRRKSAAQSSKEEAFASGNPRRLDAASPSWDEAVNGIDVESPSPAMDTTSGESSSSAGSGCYYNGTHDDRCSPDQSDDCAWTSGENIPSCELSDFVQDFLERELRAVGEDKAADTLYVRALSFPHERMSVSDGVFRAFADNSDALSQLRPEESVRAGKQRLPQHIGYLSRGLYLFQKHDGVDVCLFTLYAQEFGDTCELVSNRRSVYIAYLDSVRYLSPPSARTAAYHLIMLAYFDYIRRHGFRTVHIWSCPPQKRISYVFWCRPPFQKTPSADHLRLWYKNLLEKAKTRRIVANWTTTFDRYFSTGGSPRGGMNGAANGVASSAANGAANATGIATRGVTARSVDPSELEWPAPQLPPLFDGDLIPAELDRILGRIAARNEKVSRAASASPYYGKGSAGSTGGKRVTGTGDAVKLEQQGGAAEPSVHVDVKLREVFAKCQQAVRNLRHDLLVVDLAVDAESDSRVLPCRPEALVPAWCARVPRFFGSRFMFHQLCSHAGYQFDSLRRAKHSTLMVLHHYFNERAAVQANVFCRECSLLITHADYWSCAACDRLALCDACHRRLGPRHEHPMRFGQSRVSAGGHGEGQQEMTRWGAVDGA
jgi:hypothetical protein